MSDAPGGTPPMLDLADYIRTLGIEAEMVAPGVEMSSVDAAAAALDVPPGRILELQLTLLLFEQALLFLQLGEALFFLGLGELLFLAIFREALLLFGLGELLFFLGLGELLFLAIFREALLLLGFGELGLLFQKALFFLPLALGSHVGLARGLAARLPGSLARRARWLGRTRA